MGSMDLVQLKTANSSALRDINTLLRQISTRVRLCTIEMLKKIVKSPETEVWVIRAGKEIVGMGTLAIVMRPEGMAARIEDIVIRGEERGRGYGTLLLNKLIEQARLRGASVVQLTSNPTRAAANKLYQKLGFKLHETNSYFLKL